MMQDFIALLAAYLIGSIPTGFLIARAQGIADIRKYGSGNIGATNVSRVLGAKNFFIVLLLDLLKAYLFLIICKNIGFDHNTLLLVAAALLIGNAASLFLKFKGGKGVATVTGIMLALYPQLFFPLLVCFGLVLYLTHTVWPASVTTFALMPVAAWQFGNHISGYDFLLIFFMSLFGIFLHRENIKSYLKS